MQINIEGTSVYIGIPVYGPIVAQTAMSLINTVHYAAEQKFPVEVGFHVRGIVTWARDQVLHGFMETKHTKLFLIDSDMVWTNDDFFKMVALSTLREVVCATYPAKDDSRPIDFQIRAKTLEAQEPDELGLVRIGGCGLGFTIMDRSVVEAVLETKPTVKDGDKTRKQVFTSDRLLNGMPMGEDFAFFDDIMEAGYDIHLDPSIDLGHAGMKIWRGKALDSFRREQAA